MGRLRRTLALEALVALVLVATMADARAQTPTTTTTTTTTARPGQRQTQTQTHSRVQTRDDGDCAVGGPVGVGAVGFVMLGVAWLSGRGGRRRR